MRTQLAPLRTVLALGFGLALAAAAPAADLPKDEKDMKDPASDINKPRADARKIAFTANEGTWMSVDVSPDGGTIAFTSDRSGIENVWLMDADGKNPRALTTEKDAFVRSASWTPDGNYLVARKEDGKRAGIPPVELWVYHREGGGGIKLTSSDDVNNAGGAVVSRDGRSIYYEARQRRFNYI